MGSKVPKDISANCYEGRGEGESRGNKPIGVDSNEDGGKDGEGGEVLN